MKFCAIFMIGYLFALISADKLTVQVEPRAKDCFHYDAQGGQNIKLALFVTRGGLLDIDLRITGPGGEQIFSGMVFESSVQQFQAVRPGPYEICFSNEMARWTPKIVSFDLIVDGSDAQTGNTLTSDTLDPIRSSIKEIRSFLDQITRDQKYLRIREQRHRDTAESTNTRVFYYSLIESFILIGLTIGQVFYLRRFFNNTKRPV